MTNKKSSVAQHSREITTSSFFILQELPSPVVVIDDKKRVTFINKAYANITGQSIQKFFNKHVWMLLPKEQRHAGKAFFSNLHETGEVTYFESYWLDANKTEYVLSWHIKPIQLQGKTCYIGSAIDVTERRLAQERLLHDPLTGLDKRTIFEMNLKRSVAHAKRANGYRFAVLYLDLDNLKRYNLGGARGIIEKILVYVANTLRENIRPGDTVVRFGGDKFGIILDDIQSYAHAEKVANEIRYAIKQRINIQGKYVSVTTSIGVSYLFSKRENFKDVMEHADYAMHKAKSGGRDRVVVYEPAMKTKTQKRVRIEYELQKAVERMDDNFELFYMPIVSLDTGAISKFEALLRWRDRQHRNSYIMPDEFISIAEETGLILPIGEWVIWEACKTLRRWQDVFPEEKALTISVNVSLKQVMRGDLIKTFQDAISSTGADAARLRVEITETLVIENAERVIEVLNALRAMDITSFIDDFGKGHTSSLNLLAQLPTVALKLDKSLLWGMDVHPDKQAILRHIVQLGHSLHQQVISEGVETDAQLHQIIQMRATHGQGHWFHEAVDLYIAEGLIRTQPFVKKLRDFKSA